MIAKVLTRARSALEGYPRQFWVLFWGMLVNAAGVTLVWPFMTIFLRERLEVPLTTVTLLMTVNSIAGLAAVSVVGPLVDRFGRKGPMVVGLAAGSALRAVMPFAGTLPVWIGLMALQGALGPLYQVGADAMIADLVPAERRPGAYALLRTISNLGYAIGPAIGGFVATASYTLAFLLAAGATAIYALMILVLAHETIPRKQPAGSEGRIEGSPNAESRGGYGPVLRDRRFLAFCGLYALTGIAPWSVMMLLPVYAKEQFGVPESQSGFLISTNAAMVVLFQYLVTLRTRRYAPGPVLAVGALLFGLGAGSVALGGGFWPFWVSMVLLTVGELVTLPTGMALAARLAPAEMRGRYMGLFSLSWAIAGGLGPVLGGVLSDRVAPVATWYGGLAAGAMGAVGYALLSGRLKEA